MHFVVFSAILVQSVFSEITVSTKTPTGQIEGHVKQGKFDGRAYNVVEYLGIPYAQPPTGELRFAKPVKKGFFEQTFKANKLGPACLQLGRLVPWSSEDCLNMNIIVPGLDVSEKAVVVYIHGGWWQYGSQDLYYSPAFSAFNDVIFVTLNYRLNVYGFLAHEEYGFKGNYGLWDQHMAIQWVHDNIEAFGGDPNRITIAGNSAGSSSVISHALYPGNKGLFQGVVAESGTPVAPWAENEEYKTTFTEFVKRCGCESEIAADTASCLRKLNIEDINIDSTFRASKLHLPVGDGEFITYSPEDFYMKYENNQEFFDRLSSVNLIIGLSSSDGSWDHEAWTRIVQERAGDFTVGITEEDFMVLSEVFQRNVGLDFNALENTAIIHQYLDWSRPHNLTWNRDAFLDFSKDQEFTVGVALVANAHALGKGRGHTFMYEFDHKPTFSDLPFYVKGANHEDEIGYVYAFPGELMKSRGIDHEDPATQVTRQEVNLSYKLQELWATFAKKSHAGNLSDVLSMPWPPYTAAGGKYLKFRADGITTRRFYRGSAVHFWNVLMPAIKKAGSKQDSCLTNGEPATRPRAVVTLVIAFVTFVSNLMSILR